MDTYQIAKNAKAIKEQKDLLSQQSGVPTKDINDKNLKEVGKALDGAKIAAEKGADPTKVGVDQLKAAAGEENKSSPKDLSNQEKIAMTIASLAPTLIGFAVGGNRGGAIGAKTTTDAMDQLRTQDNLEATRRSTIAKDEAENANKLELKKLDLISRADEGAKTRENQKFIADQNSTDRRFTTQAARSDKVDARAEASGQKNKATLTEIEDRRRNIEDNLTLLTTQIKDKGTYEVSGSHNGDLDRRVEMIATDMAKLADPNSVARPSEVEMFKKGLVQSGFKNTNTTALKTLENFRSEIDSRVGNAYKIRGLINPGNQEEREGSNNATQKKGPAPLKPVDQMTREEKLKELQGG